MNRNSKQQKHSKSKLGKQLKIKTNRTNSPKKQKQKKQGGRDQREGSFNQNKEQTAPKKKTTTKTLVQSLIQIQSTK
jgi:hypothetical protein